MSEIIGKHEIPSDNGWESLMSSLEEEAGKFDPKKAEEARAQRMANRMGGAHLKPGSESVEQQPGYVGKHLSPEDRAEMEAEIEADKEAEQNLYETEYREKLNVPTSDLFTKRRVVIEEQFPALRPLSREDTRRYYHDDDFREHVNQLIEKIPGDVREEYFLLGTMVSRLNDGINANLRPDHQLAASEPNYVPVLIDEDGYGKLAVTQWKAEHTRDDLARLRELHEKNSKIVDFSHENEVDIDSFSEDLQKQIEELTEEISTLESANYSDFQPSGDKRPKTAVVLDKISNLSRARNLSYEARQTLNRKRNEFQRSYMEAKDAAELREIDARVKKLKQEKAEIEERRAKYENAGFVTKMFGRLFNSNRAKEERANFIGNSLEQLDKRVGNLRKSKGEQ